MDYGLLRKMIFYVLLGFGQAFLFCRGFSSWAAAMSSILDVSELTETFGNHLLYLFQGIDEYIPSPDEPFDFPSMWLLVIPLLLLIFLNLLQLLVGLVFGPIWGFAVNGALLLLSAYWMKPFSDGRRE